MAVEIAMRYGSPSIESGLAKLKARAGGQPVLVVPLYPQYAESSYLSTELKTKEVAQKLGMSVRFLPPFYSADEYLNTSAEIVRDFLSSWRADHVFFTFHGLPESHVKKTDRSTAGHCLKQPGCCENMNEFNRDCYRAQSYFSAREIAKRAGVTEWSIGFQSRLGRQEWIKPYTDALLPALVKKGVKRVAVASPSFTSDCLETLEEIGFRENERFVVAGGEELRLIPSLNADPRWVTQFSKLLQNSTAKLT